MGERGTEEGKEGEVGGRDTCGREEDTRAFKDVIPAVMCMRYCKSDEVHKHANKGDYFSLGTLLSTIVFSQDYA